MGLGVLGRGFIEHAYIVLDILMVSTTMVDISAWFEHFMNSPTIRFDKICGF